ncbi:MAG: hypothetical protein RMJ39_10765 [Deltaproteobacteria bacterium]|nr:hypothetical protein [Deltaproteobacteria bacterium]
MAEKRGIDWSSLWKKDDWVSVWIGFLILVIFISGYKFSMPSWKWMTDGAFQKKVEGTAEKLS